MVPAVARAAGIVVVRPARHGWEFLLLRVYRNWDFPKGMIESAESPLRAALRETCEETGLRRLEFSWGHGYRETAPYGRGKIARYYLARAGDEPVSLPVSAELGRPEHHEFRWVGAEQARALLPERLRPILEWAERTLAGPDNHRR